MTITIQPAVLALVLNHIQELKDLGMYQSAYDFINLLALKDLKREKEEVRRFLPKTKGKVDKVKEAVDRLMAWNQTLKAWALVKDTNHPLRDKVWEKVKHAYDPDEYKKFYSRDLHEIPMPEPLAFSCDTVYPRFEWVVREIERKKSHHVLDIGCADGPLCLTLGKKGIPCTGLNLYGPSIRIAEERAERAGLTNVKFLAEDFFEHNGLYPTVVMFEILEHLPDPEKGIAKAYDLVEKGGSLYLSTPRNDHIGIFTHLAQSGYKPWDDGLPAGHLRLFSAEELKALLKDYTIKQFLLDEHFQMLVEIEKL